MSPETRSRLIVLSVIVAAGVGAWLLALPAWSGPAVELCLARATSGVSVRARASSTGYLYLATEQGSTRNVAHIPTSSVPAETSTELGVVPDGVTVRLMFTRAPLEGPEAAIFREPDPAVPVSVGQAAGAAVVWDGEATPNGCLVVPFVKRSLGYRYTLALAGA